MPGSTDRVQLLNYLPAVIQQNGGAPGFLGAFLSAFQTLYEELGGEIEGTADRTTGGLPDLLDPALTPPPQFTHRAQPDFDYLNSLAGWLALPLRARPVRWEGESDAVYETRRTTLARQFFDVARKYRAQRSTLPGLDALLRAWLSGEVVADPSVLMVTDLTPTWNQVDTVFQLAPENPSDAQAHEVFAQVGLNTVLGEGPPFFFVADLPVDPTHAELRQPASLDLFRQAAQALLEGERPAHTYYRLRVRSHPMQLAAPGETSINGQPAAQIGQTTLVWEEPWLLDSDYSSPASVGG